MALCILIANTFYAPWRRRRLLKRPCHAYFHIREREKGNLKYLVQDDVAHNLKEIVLPSNSTVEVEVAYVPHIAFRVHETVFECRGNDNIKPRVEGVVRAFVEKGNLPEATQYWNRHGGFHISSRYPGRSMGSCYTMSFMIKTKDAGIYPTWLGFLTDEVDGEAVDLVIRVEDKPSTRMRCVLHKDCRLRSIGLS